MQTQIEQIVQSIKNLPLEDFDKLQQVIDAERRSRSKQSEKDDKLRRDIERFKKAEKWLKENREKYMEQWVCLEGDILIAHGKNGREVFRKAKEMGIKSPFLEHIVEEPKFFTGGWS